MITMARSGPRPQFMPMTSAPAASRFLATSAGLSPHMVRSRSWISSYWKNMVAITGRSAAALHARIAADLPVRINDNGEIAGTFYDAEGTHGFVFNGNEFTTIDFPGEGGRTVMSGINNSGV